MSRYNEHKQSHHWMTLKPHMFNPTDFLPQLWQAEQTVSDLSHSMCLKFGPGVTENTTTDNDGH